MRKNNHFLKSLKVLLTSLSIILLSGLIHAQVNVYGTDTFPVPPRDQSTLFYLQRTPNLNTVMYALNFKDRKVDADDPIHVYWIRYTEPGHPKKDLNYIQRKFAYGVKTKKTGPEEWDIRLVSYDKIKLTLKRDHKNQFKVFTRINNKDVIFEKSYIKIDGGSFWSPNVLYIELFGKDPDTGKLISTKVIPKK